MSGAWWIGQSELDGDQLNVISLPPDQNVLVTGPPGSGKTNLLILRANYLYLSGCSNIAVITFTRALKEFIASGALQYDLPVSKVKTFRQWQIDLLREFGSVYVDTSGDFSSNRIAFNNAITDVAKNLTGTKPFDALLLDEGQDYTADEMRAFIALSERIFCVADERQKIYEGSSPIETIREHANTCTHLRYHYRNGIRICKVADGIAKSNTGYQPLASTANYNETANPSSVDWKKCDSIEEQAQSIMARLVVQRTAFPKDLIGILCPKNDSLKCIWSALSDSPFIEDAILLSDDKDDVFLFGKKIIVSTFHSAKGLEFRAAHLAACEELKHFPNNRNLAYTAVTRAKTALSVYYCQELHGYFEAALNSLGPAAIPPSLNRVFGSPQ